MDKALLTIIKFSIFIAYILIYIFFKNYHKKCPKLPKVTVCETITWKLLVRKAILSMECVIGGKDIWCGEALLEGFVSE